MGSGFFEEVKWKLKFKGWKEVRFVKICGCGSWSRDLGGNLLGGEEIKGIWGRNCYRNWLKVIELGEGDFLSEEGDIGRVRFCRLLWKEV